MDRKPVLSQDSQVKVTSREPGLEPVIVKIIPHNWQPRQHLPKLNLSAKTRQQQQDQNNKLDPHIVKCKLQTSTQKI